MVLLSALLGVAYLLKRQEDWGDVRAPLGVRGPEAVLAEAAGAAPFPAAARNALLGDPSSPAALDCRQGEPGCLPLAAPGAAAPGQPAHTILAVACGAGSAQIEVASDEGFSIGDVVEIRSQVSSESKTITALDPMELDGPLISMYPVGSTVTQQAAAWSQEEAQAGQAAEDAVEDDSALAEALNVDVEPPLAAEPPQVAEPLQAAAVEASLDACGAACSSRGRSEGCGHRVLAAADNFFRGRGDACEAAYLWVSEDMPLATSRPYDCLSGFFNWKRGLDGPTTRRAGAA
ncbi:unnamed protein product [Prorocentrum cordatum]|uniref:Uncharacterized protein n=1 Tax=Prorocentrum cordatum TaxID=2364126 RepID=A0ABN9WZG8_9DINO|nr:unnamed protein product [Polarella glacialis]